MYVKLKESHAILDHTSQILAFINLLNHLSFILSASIQ